MLFRFAAVAAIGWFVHANHLRMEAEGDRPIRLSEVQAFLPKAHNLRIDSGDRGGFIVVDSKGGAIGYAARSMPHSRNITGYSGPSDVLMVADAEDKIKGIAIRHSYDTPSHVADVAKDYIFMERWNGLTWSRISQMSDLKAHKVYGVSGATRTSEAVAKSVALRAGIGLNSGAAAPSLEFRLHDLALIGLVVLALLLAFVKKGWIQRRKLWVHLLMVIYLGLVSADLLAQSLIISWAEHGVPWEQILGLSILGAAAFLIPWSTGHPVYCTHVCPHGHLQRWLMKLIPAKRKPRMGQDMKWSFSAAPGIILMAILIVVFLKLPLDLAGFEPFDAWSLKGIGIATTVVAIVGLIFSIFVPMGYCRYGCPTGFLLDLVKRERSGFISRDLWLAALLGIAAAFYFGYETWRGWLIP